MRSDAASILQVRLDPAQKARSNEGVLSICVELLMI